MFDAKMDFAWTGPLLDRAVSALESIADSLKLLAVTAQLQAKVLETHPHNQQGAGETKRETPRRDVASVTRLRPGSRETREPQA